MPTVMIATTDLITHDWSRFLRFFRVHEESCDEESCDEEKFLQEKFLQEKFLQEKFLQESKFLQGMKVLGLR